MHSECCKADLVSESGYRVCVACGKLHAMSLDVSNVSFNHSSCYISRPYSRRSRFEKKVLGLLRCMVNYKIDTDLLFFLETRNITDPEGLHQEIGLYPTKGRRPFEAIMYYWLALGFRQPVCTNRDILFLKQDFDQVYFAWERLGLKKPRFPYSFLFRKIVNTMPARYSTGIVQMSRFVRKLRCLKRRNRYDSLFKKCMQYDYLKMVDDEKIDHCETNIPDLSVVYSREKVSKPHYLSPYDVRGVYKSQKEIDAAKRRGDFNIAKTMHLAKNGNFYFLSYENENDLGSKKQEQVSMQNLQVSNAQQVQLDEALQLNRMYS